MDPYHKPASLYPIVSEILRKIGLIGPYHFIDKYSDNSGLLYILKWHFNRSWVLRF